MTFKQFADELDLNILDLVPDEEQAELMADEELFHCSFIDGLIEEGILSKDLETVITNNELQAVKEFEAQFAY